MQLDWHHLKLDVSFGKTTLSISGDSAGFSKIRDVGLTYILRMRDPYAVSYQQGASRICYIGSGRKKRFADHQVAWMSKVALCLPNLTGFDMAVCEPDASINEGHKRVENELVGAFQRQFGERPLFNRTLGGLQPQLIADDQSTLLAVCEPATAGAPNLIASFKQRLGSR